MKDASSFLKREGWSLGHEQPADPRNGRPYLGGGGSVSSGTEASKQTLKDSVGISANANHPQPGGDRDPGFFGDLADHFFGCVKLGRYLTVADNSRFVITDDFRSSPVIPEASAMAAIYSRDHLVAQAALLPLSMLTLSVTCRSSELTMLPYNMCQLRHIVLKPTAVGPSTN